MSDDEAVRAAAEAVARAWGFKSYLSAGPESRAKFDAEASAVVDAVRPIFEAEAKRLDEAVATVLEYALSNGPASSADHGRAATHEGWGCRCDPCLAAASLRPKLYRTASTD